MKTIDTAEDTDVIINKKEKPIGKNSFAYIDTLDLRPIIKTAAACENIKELKFIDTLVLPKNRDDDTMSAIAGIKMSFVEDILYLDDDEPIIKRKGVEHKNSRLVELFERDFSSPSVECKNCSIVAIHAISNIGADIKHAEFTNVASIFMDNSLKKCATSFEYKNTGSIHYCNLPEDARVKSYIDEKLSVDSELLRLWGKNAIIICHGCKLDIDEAISVEEFTDYKILFLFNSTKIKVGKKLHNHILNNSVCNNVKCRRK